MIELRNEFILTQQILGKCVFCLFVCFQVAPKLVPSDNQLTPPSCLCENLGGEIPKDASLSARPLPLLGKRPAPPAFCTVSSAPSQGAPRTALHTVSEEASLEDRAPAKFRRGPDVFNPPPIATPSGVSK